MQVIKDICLERLWQQDFTKGEMPENYAEIVNKVQLALEITKEYNENKNYYDKHQADLEVVKESEMFLDNLMDKN